MSMADETTSGFSVPLCRAMKKKETEGPRESGLIRNKEEKMKRLGMGKRQALLCHTLVFGFARKGETTRKRKKTGRGDRSRARHASHK